MKQKIFILLAAAACGACGKLPAPNPVVSAGTWPVTSPLAVPLKVRTNGPVFAIATGTDGSTYIGGQFTTVDPDPAPGFFSTDANGNSDFTLNLGSGFNGSVY